MSKWYLKVYWLHDLPDQPTTLFYEIDEDGWNTQTIEIYRDGHADIACADVRTGSTGLAEARMTPVEDIAAQDDFWPAIITESEFAEAWVRASEQQAAGR